MSTLKPGRVRYGVLTCDAGRIMDDGTISRLDDETFYVTTTSSGAGAVEQWFSWWLADWKMDVTLTDITQSLSAVNLAGPRARDILARLTDLDCSPEAFTYLDAKQARVAGVPCLLLRIGFVGELGYEIHFPAAYGEDLWDALLKAGEPEGIRPFGLEPQRILRLQKQHIIVGQDTDSESTPFGAAMPWAVKLDKEEDFIGKWALRARPTCSRRPRSLGSRSATARPDRGVGRPRPDGTRGRPGDERAPLAPARQGDRDGLGPRIARQRRRQHHDRRQRHHGAGVGDHRAVLRPGRGAAALMSTLAFLTPDVQPRTSSPARRWSASLAQAGGRFEPRDGWNVAIGFDPAAAEAERMTKTVGFADRSQLTKFELQRHRRGDRRPGADPRDGEQRDGAWWCPVTPERVLVFGEPRAAAEIRGARSTRSADASST